MARQISTGIDIGSSYIRIVVCEYIPHLGLLAVRALVKKPSRGLRHGYIINVDEITKTITEAVREAEAISEMRIKSAYLAVGGTSLGTTVGHASVVISRPDTQVTELDTARAATESESGIAERQNFKIIHTIPLEFKLDGKKVIGSPVGYHGNKLETKTLFITAQQTHLQNLVKSIEKAGIEVEDIIAAPIAESIVTLTPLQKSVGCVLANIGSETVSILIFEEGSPISLQVFPIGSTDITNDIALGFKISLEDAEVIKTSKDRERTSKKKIEEIIDARLSDIFELIDLHLKKIGRSGLLPAGIIITGGGAYLETIIPAAKKYLNLPARIGSNTIVPENFKFPENKTMPGVDTKRIAHWREMAKLVESPDWAVAFGLCMIALEGEEEASFGVKIIEKTKSTFVNWIKQFLP